MYFLLAVTSVQIESSLAQLLVAKIEKLIIHK